MSRLLLHLLIKVTFSAVETPAQQFMFPTSQAPRFNGTNGYILGIVAIAAMAAWCCFLMPVVERRFGKRTALHF